MDVITDRRRFVASRDAVSSRLGDELALLDFKTESYFTLNRTGSVVWGLLEKPQSLHDLCDEVVEQFDVSVERCLVDMEELVSQLREAGLVEVLDNETGD